LFDFENEAEKPSYRHFRVLPFKSLLAAPLGPLFSSTIPEKARGLSG
jgi:hypothetical protein